MPFGPAFSKVFMAFYVKDSEQQKLEELIEKGKENQKKETGNNLISNKMASDKKRNYKSYQSEDGIPDLGYDLAFKRVKRIKGFYIHAFVYVLVNAFILIAIYKDSVDGSTIVFAKWETWSTALFWGIGLVAHGLSVFGRNIFFGANWEEKKIREFMDKDKNTKWE